MKKLAGNPGKRRLPEHEIVPSGKLPRMPADRLTSEAQRAWIQFKVELETMGVLTAADAGSFEAMCMHYGEAMRNYAVLMRQGSVITGAHGGPIRNPADTAFIQHSSAFLKLATEFGMTASARARLASVSDPDKDKSLADLLFEELQPDKGGKPRRSPLARLVGSGPARALAGAGFGTVQLAVTAAREGLDLSSIPGVGPVSIRKLEDA